ncbi:Two-component sensor histidine kinase, contains HisKA and HATPase domains [Flaviramulus basaltis]|uniref:histidine kinase n=1 Tax=Flaviramulus basaltis TaxID=369401 RepID=A0A1K2INY6_9FLAO|nr:histidine kinase dimerization/phosphoacceptor domain -containing protein [Flaviramulus basaltis]SFZ93970.1 Two-component sensor histidine kinase, contains HisKA and HATPase domains [Flaviramulus basaltis]
MKKYLAKAVVFIVFSFFNITHGQILDFSKKHVYNKVFVDTDNFDDTYLEVLEDAYNKVEVDTIQFSILNDLAYYWHTRNLIKANKFTKEGLTLTRLKKDTLWEGRFQITEGAILLRMEKLDSAFVVLQSAKNKVKKTDLPFLNTQLGYVFERRGELDKAADYALESLRIGEELNDKKAIALAYSDLSNLFWKQAKFEKGLEFGLKSIKIFEEYGIKDLDYDFTLYVVGNNYLELKQYKEALKFYEKSIAIGERYGFYNNLSDVYISLVDLYAYLNEFEKANEAGVNAVKYAELLDNNFMVMRSWLSIGKSQNKEEKYQLAIVSLNKCIKVATKDFGDEYFLSQAYQALGKAYAGSNNYKEAYLAIEAYDKLKNEVFTAEADERISLLQTEFEVAEKENTIKVQDIKIKQQKTRQTLAIIIVVSLLLLLSLLYTTIKNNKKKNKLLEKQNKEKEFLLKEIHHRVKNNLEIVSSLLALQSAQVNDPNVLDAMQESQNRVHSMSMIHQKLYQGKNLATIEMKDYLINLGHHILDSFGLEDRIELEYAMNTIELDVDTAVPLGLIVNELLTNALKYAFPDNRKGNIKIGLQEIENNTLRLEVADDGVGQQLEKPTKGTGFGTQLINLLILQLGGSIKKEDKKGTSISFEFKLEKAA